MGMGEDIRSRMGGGCGEFWEAGWLTGISNSGHEVRCWAEVYSD